ncbi:MAG: hypothetical protein WC584_05260 [Candidatus Pacearchaeota archaeon]
MTIDKAKITQRDLVSEYESNRFKATPQMKEKIKSLLGILSAEETHKSIRNNEEFKWACESMLLWRSFCYSEYGILVSVNVPRARSLIY